ncbi:MAG: helix-turn-helix domain-containing protein [Dehalococcoidales bacterium]|jgi:predicted site-specific integrase-resolvase
MLSLNDVAAIFEVHPSTVRRWCREGKIKTCRNGRRGPAFKHEDVAIAYMTRSIRKCLGRRVSG